MSKVRDKHLPYLQVRWKNFKGFEDTNWIKIKPLTILLGSNNCGKTNFLAPLLLMNQTINSKDSKSPLILKGDSYDGGIFEDIVKDYDTSEDVFFGFRYHTHEINNRKKLENVGTYAPGSFEIIFAQDPESEKLFLKQNVIYDIFNRKFLSIKRNKINEMYRYTGIGSKTLKTTEKNAIKNSSPTNFSFTPNNILSEIDLSKEDEKKENIRRKDSQFSKGFSQFLSAISYNYARTSSYFGALSFIGPIRENPHRIYEITNENYSTVGVKGEKMPHLLKNLGTKKEELEKWIKKFGFGDNLELKHHTSNTYSIHFKEKNTKYITNIANTGFGASQVLPLIVQSIISPEESITIAEQPEIHLNPRIQSVLAELFVSMANKGQIVLIETHSEHLLLRLRTLIAENEINSDDVAIYFVEKKNQCSSIREIKLQENGHIKAIDWPKDFLAESLKESFALASAQSKRKTYNK